MPVYPKGDISLQIPCQSGTLADFLLLLLPPILLQNNNNNNNNNLLLQIPYSFAAEEIDSSKLTSWPMVTVLVSDRAQSRTGSPQARL